MRLLSILLNIALLSTCMGNLASDGWPRDLVYQLMVVLFIITPIVNLIALKIGNSFD